VPIADPDERRAYHREWMRRRRASFFADKACAECGAIERLELNHLDPETKVSHAIWSWSEKRRLAEIAKCEIVCRDCHHARHREHRRVLAAFRERDSRGRFVPVGEVAA
jgi:hypothetical protein